MRYLQHCATLALFTALLLGACALPAAQPAPGVTITDAGDAAITSERRGDVLILDVRSQGGIGSAQVALAPRDAPRDIILRLHLRGLENLTFAYDAGSVQLAVASSGEPLVTQSFARAGEIAAQPIAAGSPYWMALGILSNNPAATPAIPLESGYFDVSVPPDYLTSADANFMLSWIDFYR